jgi:SpoIID/LytB domain protein
LRFLVIVKLLLFWFVCFSQTAGHQQPLIRVLIIQSAQNVTLNFLSEFDAVLSKEKHQFKKGDSVTISALNKFLKTQINDEIILTNKNKMVFQSENESALLKIKNVPYGVGWWWEGKEDRFYNCTIEVVLNKNDLIDVIAIMPIEKYLQGVVPNEIGSDSPFEALKAQVISARTETMHALISRKYAGENYDICSDVDCQVYGGINKKNSITDSAIKVTEGLCLTFNDEIIPAYFSSNCGGMSESIEKVWENRSPAVDYYLSQFDSDDKLTFNPKQNPADWIKSSPEVFCNPQYHNQLPNWSKNNFRWKIEIKKEVLNNNLNEIKPIGKLKKIIIIERGHSGRIIKTKFIGEKDSLELTTELSIRKIVNPPLKSSNFIIENYSTSDTEIPDNITLLGAGWGHGVGLCQSGAIGRAHSGQDYEKILFHYYPNTKIKKIY